MIDGKILLLILHICFFQIIYGCQLDLAAIQVPAQGVKEAQEIIPLIPQSLITAAQNGHVEVVRMLLAAGVDPKVDTHPFPSRTALSWAAGNGSFEIAQMLLNAGANCNLPEVPFFRFRVPLLCRNNEGQIYVTPYEDTALSQAVLSGRVAMVKMLLDAGANPDCSRSSPIAHCWKKIYATNQEEILYLLVQKSKRKEQFLKCLPRELFLRSIRSKIFIMAE